MNQSEPGNGLNRLRKSDSKPLWLENLSLENLKQRLVLMGKNNAQD